MSRSIVKSKINAKYNPVQTGGGGGGSAIAVYDEATLLTTNATSFTFTGLGIDATASGGAVTVTVNNNEIIEVKNATVSTIPKGAVCYIDTLGTSGTHPEILLASAATESTSSKTIGVTANAIAPGTIGQLIINGEITGTGAAPLNTSAYNAGAMLWLSNTPGQWTTTIPPFPSHAVFIGHVTRSQVTNGRVVIKIQNGYEVQELHDTQINSKSNGQFLMVDTITYAPNTAWVNQRLVTQVTVSQLTSLRNNVSLIPGMTYWITNAPIIFLTGIGTANFFIKAINTDALESCGTLEVLYTTPPASYRGIQCWYDLDTNTHPKISDPYNKNTIEGWTNIQNFMVLINPLGGIFSPSVKDNTIINSSTLTVPGPITGLNSFFGNYLDQSSLTFTGATNAIGYIENNKLITSSINFQGTDVVRVLGNHLKNSSIQEISGISSLQELRYNYIENSTIIFDKNVPDIVSFEYNRINHSAISIEDVVSLFYFNKNFIDTSNITLNPESSISGFNENNVHKSEIIFLGTSVLNAFEKNTLNASTISILGTFGGSGNMTYNTIEKSYIDNTASELNYCNIFGMGVGSNAIINTGISYNYCNYRLYEDSTFYNSYDVDDISVYDPATGVLTLPAGHEPWVGKIIMYSSTGSGATPILRTLGNPIVNHRYYVYLDASLTRIDVDIVSGFFVLPLALGGLLSIATIYDFGYFDPRATLIGVSTAGESVLIDYENY